VQTKEGILKRVKRKRAYEKTEGQKDKHYSRERERKRERKRKREGKREGKKEAEGQRKRKRKTVCACAHAVVTQRSSAVVTVVVPMLCLPPSPYICPALKGGAWKGVMVSDVEARGGWQTECKIRREKARDTPDPPTHTRER
jgi:hypothetical protein